jgi:hypothetical protein
MIFDTHITVCALWNMSACLAQHPRVKGRIVRDECDFLALFESFTDPSDHEFAISFVQFLSHIYHEHVFLFLVNYGLIVKIIHLEIIR